MEVSFEELREKEVINIYSGKKLGHIIDLVFDISNGIIKGVIVPGDKKLFKKSDDVFVSLRQIRRIGDDVILVGINGNDYFEVSHKDHKIERFKANQNIWSEKEIKYKKGSSYIRYRRINNNKYK